MSELLKVLIASAAKPKPSAPPATQVIACPIGYTGSGQHQQRSVVWDLNSQSWIVGEWVTTVFDCSLSCLFIPGGAAQFAITGNGPGQNPDIGNGASPICSTLHSANTAPDASEWACQIRLNFPVSGTYRIGGIADNAASAKFDCEQQVLFASIINGTPVPPIVSGVTLAAGSHLVTVNYLNADDTGGATNPAWFKFWVENPDGSVLYATNPEFWGSTRIS